MHLARKLFGEILPFRMNHVQRNVPVKGGLAWQNQYFEANHTFLFPVEDDGLKARVSYASIPPELPEDAIWFHDIEGLQLHIVLPEGYRYELKVKVLATPEFFLNEAGRPEHYPPSEQNDAGPFYYTLEISDNRWWSSDEHSAGHEWHFSVNDLPPLPSIRDSGLCQLNTVPGIYPGAYFTCTLKDPLHSDKPVEYWFNYELESRIDRTHYLGSDKPAGERYQYRFSFGRTDKQELHINEGHRILDLWEHLLGFCSGSFRRADIIIGYSGHGSWAYAELPSRLSRLTRQLPYRFSWFPQEWPIDFPAFASQFLTCFQKDYDMRSKLDGVPADFFDPGLRIRHGFGSAIPVLEGYLRAASSDIPHDALNAAFATLESEVKRCSNLPDQQRVPPGGISQFLRSKGIPPGERSHAFGSRENSSWRPTRDIAGLKERPQGASGWILEPDYKPDNNADPVDEEYGINAIKSWRDKRASHFDAYAGGGTFYDIRNYAQLTLEYLELLMLEEIGYEGLYRSRIGMFKQAVRTVPWAEESTDGKDATSAE